MVSEEELSVVMAELAIVGAAEINWEEVIGVE